MIFDIYFIEKFVEKPQIKNLNLLIDIFFIEKTEFDNA